MNEAIPIDEYFKLAILDLSGIRPIRTEWTGKYWAYFNREEAEPLLRRYDSGVLVVPALDFVSAVRRVKDRIFEAQRQNRKQGAVNSYGKQNSISTNAHFVG